MVAVHFHNEAAKFRHYVWTFGERRNTFAPSLKHLIFFTGIWPDAKRTTKMVEYYGGVREGFG